jgi:hypothetical protein
MAVRSFFYRRAEESFQRKYEAWLRMVHHFAVLDGDE